MILRALLHPLSWLYAGVMRLRNWLYDSGWLRVERCSLAVISVGNLSLGGNAKTPLCVYLAQELRSRGFSPVVLSRGYKGKVRGVHLVLPKDDAARVGDEPRLIADVAQIPVVVAADRVAGARMIERERLGDVIILDDGFQHRRLARDLDIVSVSLSDADEEQRFLRGEVLPLGLFRESKDAALRRATAVVGVSRKFSSTPYCAQRLRQSLPGKVRFFGAQVLPNRLESLDGVAAPKGGKIAAFCGIANPQGFFGTLQAMGYELVWQRAYGDHYACTAAELKKLLNQAQGLPLVCTEKDAVKLKHLAEPGAGIYVLGVEIRFDGTTDFMSFVTQLLRERALRKV